nr:EamA family transporter [Halarchaeum acidiphilum]
MTRYRDALLFCVLATAWGSAFVAIKAGLAHFPPVFFAALRYDVAAVLMFAYVGVTADRWRPRTRREWLTVAVGGLLLIAAYHAFLFAGEARPGVTSAAAAVVSASAPSSRPGSAASSSRTTASRRSAFSASAAASSASSFSSSPRPS